MSDNSSWRLKMLINYQSFLCLVLISIFTTLVLYYQVLFLFNREDPPELTKQQLPKPHIPREDPRELTKQTKLPDPQISRTPSIEPQCCKFEEVLSFDRVTIVTGLINIKNGSKFSRQTYMHWSYAFARVTNPVYAFFTDDVDITNFRRLRKSQPASSTKIIKVDIDKTWAFSLRHNIENIFHRKDYPTHSPNTVIPSYPCAMNAKYEFLLQAIEENPFKTDYFSWMDLGYLRQIVNTSDSPLLLHLPPKFIHQQVAYTETERIYSDSLTAEFIVTRNLVWVAGGFFIGRSNILKKLVVQYKATVEAMLMLGWVSTDQQVLYYMVQPKNNLTKEVGIQGYRGGWFHLGFLCMCSVKYECIDVHTNDTNERR